MVDIPAPAPPSGEVGDESARQEQTLLQDKPVIPGLDEARHRYALACSRCSSGIMAMANGG
jgi:hypothetical protein